MPAKPRHPLVRRLVRQLHPYVPGEQPKIKGLIKLNTNENPYPPSPKVLAAVRAAVDDRLRLYPNPTAQPLRERLARLHDCSSSNIFVGNGSDELLALAVRAFVEPLCTNTNSLAPSEGERAGGEGNRARNSLTSSPLPSPPFGEERERTAVITRCAPSLVQYFTPSYSLYPVLADIHGAAKNAVPLNPDFGLPALSRLRRNRQWDFHAALTFVTTPNAPSGRGYATSQLDSLCRAQQGVVVLDEAYVDFADENALALALKHPHVLVARTFSKAYSLCFQRVGYFVGHAELIGALDKIRDSYNVNGLGQIAALATLEDLPYYRANFGKIVATRRMLTGELGRLGFEVLPSQTNFILARPPKLSAERWLTELRARKVLVRWFADPLVRDYLRITIGTAAEAASLLKAAKSVLH